MRRRTVDVKDFYLLSKEEKEKWEVRNSSFYGEGVTYKEVRKRSTESIVNRITPIQVKPGEKFYIPRGEELHLMGRVPTSVRPDDPKSYKAAFTDRTFASFTLVNKKNLSHYPGSFFFLHNIVADDIVHVFPTDSDTNSTAKTEERLTSFPSLWLSGEDLEKYSLELGVYCQVTAKTKRANGKINWPYALLTFSEPTKEEERIAEAFKVGIIVAPPAEKGTIAYTKDLLYDWDKLAAVSEKLKERYGISIYSSRGF